MSKSEAVELLEELQSMGVSVIVSGDRIRLRPGSSVPAALLDEVRRVKSDIVGLLAKPTIDPEDRSTWPAYLVKLERRSLEAFGPEAASRQVRAELAFLERAEGEGWHILDQPIRAPEDEPKEA